MFIEPEAFAEIKRIQDTANKPLPKFFVDNKELLMKIYNSDRTYAYSDDVNVWRNGTERKARHVTELEELVTDDESKHYVDLISRCYEHVEITESIPEFAHPDFTGKDWKDRLGVFAKFVLDWGITSENHTDLEEELRSIDSKLTALVDKAVVLRPWNNGKVIYRGYNCSYTLLNSTPLRADSDVTFFEHIKSDAVAIGPELNTELDMFFHLEIHSNPAMAMYIDWCNKVSSYSSKRPTELAFVAKNDGLALFRVGSILKHSFYGICHTKKTYVTN